MSIDGFFTLLFVNSLISCVVFRVRINIGVNVETIKNKMINVTVVTIIASVSSNINISNLLISK